MATRVTAAGSETAADEAALEQRFVELAREWRAAGQFDAFASDPDQDPRYRAIIEMGEAAVPWILRDLSQTGDHWFHALRAITGENPAADAQPGRIREFRDAWLQWGRERGLVE